MPVRPGRSRVRLGCVQASQAAARPARWERVWGRATNRRSPSTAPRSACGNSERVPPIEGLPRQRLGRPAATAVVCANRVRARALSLPRTFARGVAAQRLSGCADERFLVGARSASPPRTLLRPARVCARLSSQAAARPARWERGWWRAPTAGLPRLRLGRPAATVSEYPQPQVSLGCASVGLRQQGLWAPAELERGLPARPGRSRAAWPRRG
jgi:hypothetical protein